jgi:hypothetical protein
LIFDLLHDSTINHKSAIDNRQRFNNHKSTITNPTSTTREHRPGGDALPLGNGDDLIPCDITNRVDSPTQPTNFDTIDPRQLAHPDVDA